MQLYEESVEPLSLVPHFEALLMPITVRTSNAEAHACMYIAPLAYLIYNKVYLRLGDYTSMDIYRCLIPDRD